MRDDKGKKGQVTLFIIIAIVIVVIGVLIFAFYPKLKATTGFSVENPEAFLQDCVGDDLRGLVKTISKQGGSLSPSNYAFYDQTELQYLCYTENYNEAGSRYPAFLVDSFQQEITENIKLTIDNCFDSLEENYKSKFYSTTLRKSLGKIETKILPKEIRLELLNYELTIAKDSTEKYTSFNILLNSNLYELLGISSDILEDEVNFGQADKIQYMMDNSNLEITGPKYSDGTNVYIIKNKKTNEVFQFASRSLVPQPGV